MIAVRPTDRLFFAVRPDAEALEAIWQMSRAPGLAPFLRAKMPPVAAPDGERVRKLIQDLDNRNFAAREAATLAEKLRANYEQMLDEHRQLVASLKELEAAATAENQPRAAQFARALALHAQNEEQVLYPAALLVGEYLKLRQPPPGHGHDAR